MELTRETRRLARSAALGGAAVALALAAHVGAGAASPGPGVVAMAVLLATVTTTLCAGRRLSRLKTLALLGGMQVILHTTFTCLADRAPIDTQIHGHGPSSHRTRALDTLPAGAGMPPMDMSAGMILAHAGATTALALLLAYGETLLWSLAAYFGRRLPDRPVGAVLPSRTAPVAPLLSPTHEGIDPVPSRRGPPQAIFA
ncbi:hypothetical protein [Leekyejoonella antrihumi]|uniref:Uncharacterized protein n=1 Tax=Leekyejoonella antrihumi TaxID=1660198 RepID=A0A563DXB2_9MICO|nr:hypothetical protein [Leekyejoonella antrihumi]TWP34573.1 hypothetical protein FGL98_16900 [Leekyejoonella antrihumi]